MKTIISIILIYFSITIQAQTKIYFNKDSKTTVIRNLDPDPKWVVIDSVKYLFYEFERLNKEVERLEKYIEYLHEESNSNDLKFAKLELAEMKRISCMRYRSYRKRCKCLGY